MTGKTVEVGSWTVVAIEAHAVWTAESIYILGGVEHSVSGDIAGEARLGVEANKARRVAVVAFLAAAVVPEDVHARTKTSGSVDGPRLSGIARGAAGGFDAGEASVVASQAFLCQVIIESLQAIAAACR